MCNRNIPLRLPKTVIPIHYNLTVTPDLNSFTFQGNLSIKLQILEQTKEIFLHAVDLNIKEVKIFSTHSESVNIINKYDFVKIVFEDFIPPGIWHLHFLYEGIINNDKRGLYRSKYNNENGNEKYMIVTQFAPTDSRRCFPCFDEPCFKSTFSLTVVVPNNLISLSNMPVKVKVQETNLLTRFEYQTTPIMPTYLLAFIVGEFDYVEDKFNKIRVYTPKLENKCATVALKYASESLSFYKNYFGMDYKVPKMDLISVVEFDFDAMENWGLIIFREDVLHPSTEKPSLHYKIRVAEVIGHEFAHQWFGNLVTMEWWNKLWLNEGFASYFQFIWLSHAFSLDVWEQFVDVTLEALHIDSLISSRSLEAPITEAEGILEVFDVITYRKGAAIIKMLHDFVGDDVFKNGIRKYLNQNKFGNTSSRHLWKAFSDFKNGLVGEVMASWINQTGYPLLEVSRKSEKGTVRLVISQKHFRHELQECNVLWKIPLIISYVTSDLTVQTIKLLLEQRETELKLYNIPTDCWIKVNRGYYRVQYTPDMLETLIPAIKYKTISSSDRLGILDDMFALMKYRKITSVCFLNFLKAYEKETFYIILKRMLSIFRYMSCLLEYHGLKEVFNKFQRKFLHSVLDRINLIEYDLRKILLEHMMTCDYEFVSDKIEQYFNSELFKIEISYYMKHMVIGKMSENDLNRILGMYTSSDGGEKLKIIKLLGNIRQENLLIKLLSFSLSDRIVSQESVQLILTISSSLLGRNLAWNFIKTNINYIFMRLKKQYFYILVKKLTLYFATEEMAVEIENFFRGCEYLGKNLVHQCAENVRINSKWLNSNAKTASEYLLYY